MIPEVISVGPFSIYSSLLVYAVGFVLAILMIKHHMNVTEQTSATGAYLDIVINSILIIMLTWKFGHVLFQPSVIWTNPWKLVMLPGSTREMVLGLIAAFIYIFYKIQKRHLSFKLFFDMICIFLLIMTVCKQLWFPIYGMPAKWFWGISNQNETVAYHPVHIYIFGLSLILLVWFIYRKYRIGQGLILRDMLLGYGIGRMIISYGEASYINSGWISYEQLMYLSMIAIGLHILIPKRR